MAPVHIADVFLLSVPTNTKNSTMLNWLNPHNKITKQLFFCFVIFVLFLYSNSCNSHSFIAACNSFPESVKYRKADSMILFIPRNTRICSSEYVSDLCINRSRILFFSSISFDFAKMFSLLVDIISMKNLSYS